MSWLFRRGDRMDKLQEARKIKHGQEQEERIARMEAESRALNAYVKSQPNLRRATK